MEKYINKQVAFRLVNAKRNAEILARSPHVMIGDMAAIFTYVKGLTEERFEGEKEIPGTVDGVDIENWISDPWGLSPERLFEIAQENTPSLLPVKTGLMREVAHIPDASDNLYVVTNTAETFGAGAMFYPGLMEKMAEEFNVGGFYILPSSIHKVLILLESTEKYDENLAILTGMVRDVNEYKVEPDEILSDFAIFWSKETGFVQDSGDIVPVRLALAA